MAEQNDESYSEDKSFETGVHQWSILGPLLFISYLLSLRTLLIEFLASYHIYTDDITFYLKFDLGTTFASFLNHRKIIASVLKLLTASKIKNKQFKHSMYVRYESKNSSSRKWRELIRCLHIFEQNFFECTENQFQSFANKLLAFVIL